MKQNNGIKVSIKVLSFNQEKYIKQTLDSILNQKHPYTYEIIVCDDASKDSTPQIITEYASKHKEIIPVLRNKNIGLLANYFDAVKRCRGEYIMGCGGDDYWLPGKIADQVEFMDNHPEIGLVYSDIRTISEQGNYISAVKSRQHTSVEDLIKYYTIKAPTLTLRKTDFTTYIEETKPLDKNWLMEDLPISIWFSIQKKLSYLPGEYAAYRIVNNSISHQSSIDRKLKFEQSAFDIFQYFQSEYPNELSKKFILSHHLNCLCNNQKILESYNSYCYKILTELNNNLGENYENYTYYLRIKYPLINRFYLFTKKIVVYQNFLLKKIQKAFIRL